MALEFTYGYGYMDDGHVGYVPKDKCNCDVTTEDVSNMIAEMIEEKDNYITSGTYEDNKITLTTNHGKTTEIENLPEPKPINVEEILNEE